MKNRKAAAVRRAIDFAVESLESRRLLSTVTLIDNGDMTSTVKIVGTNGKDTIEIYDDPSTGSIEVKDDKNHDGDFSDNGEIFVFVNANLTGIDASMKKGDDHFEIEVMSDFDGDQRSYDVDLGEGNDRFEFSSPTEPIVCELPGSGLAAGPGADITNRSDISFTIEGESGNDHITFDLSRTSIISSAVSINLDTESGNDTVDLLLPDDNFEESIGGGARAMANEATPNGNATVSGSAGSDLLVQIDLGSGKDKMNLTNNTAISNSAVKINVLGDSGDDTFNDTEAFFVFNDATLSVNANLGSGNDHYNGRFSIGDGFSLFGRLEVSPNGVDASPSLEIEVDAGSSASFNIQGSTGNDKLEMDDPEAKQALAPQIFPGLVLPAINGLLDLELHGGAGNDLAEIDFDPSSIVTVGDAGTFRGIISGDDGKDHLRLDVLASGGSIDLTLAQPNLPPELFGVGNFDIQVLGGGDNDVIGAAFQLINESANTADHYGPRGAILVDGGKGTDKYDIEGNGLFNKRGLEKLDPTLENPFVV